MALSELISIDGRAISVMFRNEENGYSVLKFETDDSQSITVVGCIPCAAPGEYYTLVGFWTEHPSYGSQFRVERFDRSLPDDEEGIAMFIGSGLIPGIGNTLAQRIVDKFGTDTFDVLAGYPEKLSQVKGITEKKAEEIVASFSEQLNLRRILEFMLSYGFSADVAMRLYSRLGPLAVDAVRRNPYILVDDYYGVSFDDADGFAASLGIDPDSTMRVEAAIRYTLIFNGSNGHVFIPYEKLFIATAQLLKNISHELFDEAMEELTLRGDVVRETICKQDACYLETMYDAECGVAKKIFSLMESPKKLADMDMLLDSAQHHLNITYAACQCDAIRMAIANHVMILTGGPGTGKTTTIRGIIYMFEEMGLRIALAAPTGRAAKRMSELCGYEAKTIHRLLETTFTPDGLSQMFMRNEDNPLDADAIIVDEVSMVDIQLMHGLLNALRPGTRLIMVGDHDQLPSVGAGNVLRDLIGSGCIATAHLTEIFRQAQESMIVMNAHAINAGGQMDLKSSKDFFYMRRVEPYDVVETVTGLCKTRLPSYFNIDPREIQVISPTKQRETGTHSLNHSLQAALNPPRSDRAEKKYGDTVFRVGDRVMQIRNNYDINWHKEDGSEAGLGIFNGDIGVIREINPDTELITVCFDDKLANYSVEQLGELELAYAITVHKSQGSEFTAVVLTATDAPKRLLSRNLLYTAVTRAKKYLVIVGTQEILEQMIENNIQHKRYTALRVRLRRLCGSGAEQ